MIKNAKVVIASVLIIQSVWGIVDSILNYSAGNSSILGIILDLLVLTVGILILTHTLRNSSYPLTSPSAENFLPKRLLFKRWPIIMLLVSPLPTYYALIAVLVFKITISDGAAIIILLNLVYVLFLAPYLASISYLSQNRWVYQSINILMTLSAGFFVYLGIAMMIDSLKF